MAHEASRGRKIGDRVGAISGAEDDEVRFFGYGIYEGDFIPEEAVGFFAEARREIGGTNPRIRLDSGKVVYGCECWWGGEEAVKKVLSQYPKIVNVDIDERREQHRRKNRLQAIIDLH